MQSLRDMWSEIVVMVGGYAPNLIAALVILIVGWLVALILGAVTRGVLKRTTLDRRLAGVFSGGEPGVTSDQVGGAFSKGIYYLVMLFVLIAFLQALNLTLTTQPLNSLLTQVFEFAPKLAGAGLLLLVAWIVATVLRLVITRALGVARVDHRLGARVGMGEKDKLPITKTLGEAIYWLVFLLFLPAILGALSLYGLLEPVQELLNKFLGFLPNVVTAGLVLLIGWFAARVVQRVVTNILMAIGTDRLGERVGLGTMFGEMSLSGLLGHIVYVLVLLPVLIAALNALALDAVSAPASAMLGLILQTIPSIFAAAFVVGVAYVVARVVAVLAARLLAGAGFDTIFVKMGLRAAKSKKQRPPSEIVGYLILLAIMLFATTEALAVLGFDEVSNLVAQFTVFAGHVLMGLVILGIGLYLSKLASNAVRSSGATQAPFLANVARVAILVLAGAMALQRMGLANEIIELAFGILLGAFAVAVAIAFGLGGRETAARLLERKTRKS